MKRTLNIWTVLMLTFVTAVHAQPTPTWTKPNPNKADFLRHSFPDGDLLVITTRSEACAMNGKTGEIIWQKTFSDIISSKKVDVQYVNQDAGIIFLYDKRMGKDLLACLDLHTGNLLWQTDRFEGFRIGNIVYIPEVKSFVLTAKDGFHMLDARTGEIKWSTDRFRGALADKHYDSNNNELLALNYKTSWGALFSGFKNQLMSIDAQTGKVNWEAEYFGVIHTSPFSRRLVFDWEITPEHIILMIQGVQVIDRKTGKEIWKSDFNFYDVKGLGNTYIYGGVTYPLIDGEFMYLVYNKPMSGKVMLQKLRMRDGSIVWETKLEGRNPVIPYMKLVDGNLVLQVGGLVTIEGSNSKGETFQNVRWDGPFGVMVVNAENGSVVWQNTKLKKRSIAPLVHNNQVITADEKALYIFDLASGNLVKTVNIKEIKAGAPVDISMYDNKVLFLGENGLTVLDAQSMLVKFNVPLKKLYGRVSERFYDHYYLANKKQRQYLRLSDGSVPLKFNQEKNSLTIIANKGKTVFYMNKKGISRYDLN